MGMTAKKQMEVMKRYEQGILLTFGIAIIASVLAKIPFLSVMGQLVIAIIIGMIWRAVIGLNDGSKLGVTFSSKRLLKVGIILLGMRLNLLDIYHAGAKVFLIAVIHIIFTLVVVYVIAKMLHVKKEISVLTACGTAICGAAAVVAIAPQVKAKEEEVAVSATNVAILGTLFTLLYTSIYPFLSMSSEAYGVWTGGTLHEVAHVIAAANVGGEEAMNQAIIMKLTRVALLVPVALLIGYLFQRKESGSRQKGQTVSIIPWFIFGFLLMSGVHTLGIVSEQVATNIVNIAYVLLAMAMAGLGLQVEFKALRKIGIRPFVAGFIGSVLLVCLGYILVTFFVA